MSDVTPPEQTRAVNPAWAATSDTTAEVIAAWITVQGQLEDVVADQIADVQGREGKAGYSYRYADLGGVLKMIRTKLHEAGLAVSQVPTQQGNGVIVHTTIMHSSGEWITFQPLGFAAGGTPQATGSAITYARRYSLMSICGLATDDDDGAAAQEHARRAPQNAPDRPQNRRQSNEQAPRGDSGGAAQQTAAERTIRSLINGIRDEARKDDLINAFRRRFGSSLTNLAAEHHAAALEWTKLWITDRPAAEAQIADTEGMDVCVLCAIDVADLAAHMATEHPDELTESQTNPADTDAETTVPDDDPDPDDSGDGY